MYWSLGLNTMLSSPLYLPWSYFPTLYRFIYGRSGPIHAVINIPLTCGDLVTGRVEAMEVKRNTFAGPLG